MLAAVLAAAALATATPATAAEPVPLAPSEGASFVIGAPIDFSVRDETPGKSVYIHISRSPALDAVGLIGDDVWIGGTTGGPDFSARWKYSGLQAPGTYYWQAHRIDCSTPSYPDCEIEGPVRSLTLTGPTARLAVAGACYRENSSFRLTGSGFTPGVAVALRVGSRSSTTTADARGGISAMVKAPDVFSSYPRQELYDLKASEVANPSNAATLPIRVTSLAMTMSPSVSVRPGERVKYSFSGFVSGRPIYAHFRLGGVTRATVRLGVATAPCGKLSARAEMIPKRIMRAGSWNVQYDAQRRYSRRSTPQLVRTIRVSVVRLSTGHRG